MRRVVPLPPPRPRLPSHEGSGLKYVRLHALVVFGGLPSREGSGLKYRCVAKHGLTSCLPSHEGSGLKWK